MRSSARPTRPWRPSLVCLAVLVLAVAVPTPAFAWQAAEAPAEIGAPPILEPAWSFVGRSQAAADQITAAGRLTALGGLGPAELTADADDGTEAGSQFTFVAELTATGTVSRGEVMTSTGDGLLTIYLHDGAALDADDPASFQSGVSVAVFTVRFQASARRQAPQQGIVTGTMALTQTESFTFTLDDVRYRFGHAGLQLALRYTGGLVTSTGDPAATAASLFGTARVSQRADNPSDTGEAAAAGGELTECELLVAWIDATRARLATAEAIRSGILTGPEPSLDELTQNAASVAGLAADQRNQAAPEAAGGAGRLALTALSTDARGLELLVSAAETGDGAAETQAASILADGAALSSRTVLTLDELTPTCEPAS